MSLGFFRSAAGFLAELSGTAFPRLVLAFVGLIVCLGVLVALWEGRLRAVWAAVWLLVGAAIVFGAVNPRVMAWFDALSYLVRIRLLMGFLSVMVLLITLEAIRLSHMQERYALLWVGTGVVILLCALFPGSVRLISLLVGTEYVTSVVAVVFSFLLLVAFHFSLAMSRLQNNQTRLVQQCALLEARLARLEEQVAGGAAAPPRAEPAAQPAPAAAAPAIPERPVRGTIVVAWAVVAVAAAAVLAVGLVTPQAIVGDEVTHYYMLVRQAHVLPAVNVAAEIPMGNGEHNYRFYPHAFLWHYAGALLYRLTGGSFAAIQVYQALFLVQFLAGAFLLARLRGGVESGAAALFLVALATLPMTLIFSVTFYQDVPVAAQVITAFYLLRRGRWLWGAVFMGLAAAIKETAILFFPPYLACVAVWQFREGRMHKALPALAASALVLFFFCWSTAFGLQQFSEYAYYPWARLQRLLLALVKPFAGRSEIVQEITGTPGFVRAETVSAYEAQVIANHPGDLRRPENFLVYGGIVMWLVLLLGAAGWVWGRRRARAEAPRPASSAWLWLTGLFFLVVSGVFLRTAPDARFFLPGLPFVLLPLSEYAAHVRGRKVWLSLLAAIGILQGGMVLAKTRELRGVSEDLREAMAFLEERPELPGSIFMYPEGSYRLFPCAVEWYLGYDLRKFWRADNDTRIEMLHQFGVGAVVVKKRLVAEVDEDITNLGVYPDFFVRDIAGDSRFEKLFENEEVTIYRVP